MNFDEVFHCHGNRNCDEVFQCHGNRNSLGLSLSW